MRIKTLPLAASFSLAALFAAADANTTIAHYDAAYFSSFAPTTALDIAQRVPGFVLDLGPEEEVRGFAAAAGNVVINGSRPTSKTDDLKTVLTRIPAGDVASVEIVPGSQFGADYGGRAQVLNVVLARSGGVSGNVEARATHLYTGDVIPDGEGSVVWAKGSSTLTVSAGAGRNDVREEGSDVLYAYPSLERIEFRKKTNVVEDRKPYVSVNYARDADGGATVHANLRYGPEHFMLRQDALIVPAEGEGREDQLTQLREADVFEASGDLSHPLAGGTVKLVALATHTRTDQDDTIFLGIDQGVTGGFVQESATEEFEAIGRMKWSHADILGFSIEGQVEGAFNELDSDVELFTLAGGERSRVDLPVDNAVVAEWRGEASFTAARPLTKRLRLQTGVSYELSELEVTGDAEADRSLTFLKPSLSLDWRNDTGFQAQVSARRTVAQLDFADFIAGAELANERVNAGNANLVPQRAWEFRATLEQRILKDGVAKIEIGHDRVSELQDRILTEGGFDAPGNIGDGELSFVRGTFDTPLEPIGLDGARFKAVGILRETSVKDPITGEDRNFTGIFPDSEYRLEYRHDLGKFAYGATLVSRDDVTFFRTGELDSFYVNGPASSAFAEYRPDPKTVLGLRVENPLDNGAGRDRLLSRPNRSVAPSLLEVRERNRHPAVTLSFKRQLG